LRIQVREIHAGADKIQWVNNFGDDDFGRRDTRPAGRRDDRVFWNSDARTTLGHDLVGAVGVDFENGYGWREDFQDALGVEFLIGFGLLFFLLEVVVFVFFFPATGIKRHGKEKAKYYLLKPTHRQLSQPVAVGK
jgi:hypothetical protein